MYQIRNTFLLFLIFFLVNNLRGQDKEVLLVGTMHTVPKIVKHSYRPMLNKVLKYHPDAIFVESPLPRDTVSWEYLKEGWSSDYANFYILSDSLRKNFHYDQRTLAVLLKKDFEMLQSEELNIIIQSFGYLRDHANHNFYQYLKKHGVKGTRKPMRHEDSDLTAKLALKLGIKRLKSFDDQQTNREYHEAWRSCAQEGRNNGDNKINRRLNKKDYNNAIIPALFGRLGIHVNKRRSLERLHLLASFTYVRNQTAGCSLGERYWNERNKRMAQNIGNQIMNGKEKRNVVIVGASHIIGIENELKENYPNLKIKLINE